MSQAVTRRFDSHKQAAAAVAELARASIVAELDEEGVVVSAQPDNAEQAAEADAILQRSAAGGRQDGEMITAERSRYRTPRSFEGMATERTRSGLETSPTEPIATSSPASGPGRP